MMRNDACKKALILAIIVLFLGIIYIPCISGNIDESIDKEIVNDYEKTPLQVTLIRPENGIYFNDQKILPFFKPLVLCGSISIEVEVEPLSEVERIEFLLNGVLQKVIVGPPWLLTWSLGGWSFSKLTFGIIAYDFYGNQASDEITIWRIFC